MIACDRFVFLHLHKSGGTFVNHMLMTCVRSAQRLGYHLPYSELPEAFRHLPVLGTVRNPWSYYVSWFHFQQAQTAPNPLFLICSEDRKLGFEATITNLVTLGDNAARIDALVAAVPDRFVNHGLNLTKACVEKMRGSDAGFYTFLHDRLYAGAPTPRIMPMENLRAQLLDVANGLRGLERLKVQQFLESTPDLNVSEHEAYQGYYSDGLAQLVSERDRGLIHAYRYTF